eukprot:2859425-Amphidinium_carterae.2
MKNSRFTRWSLCMLCAAGIQTGLSRSRGATQWTPPRQRCALAERLQQIGQREQEDSKKPSDDQH